jgi:hypothetical protein
LAAAQSQSNCQTCSGSCAAPVGGASCENGVWVYSNNQEFSGTVSINCPIRVQGNAVFAANTNLNINSCGRITATGFNAPDGVGIRLDMNGNAARQGSKFVFANFQSSQGFISRLNVINIGGGATAAPGLNPRLGNGEGAIHFRAPGDNDMRTGNGNINEPVGPPPDPNFDSDGNRINRCNALTCRDENACGRPSPEAICENSGEWSISGNFDLRTADISCPLRIRGDLRVTESLTVRGCGRLTVDGTATLGNENVNNENFASNGITATFDLNDLGSLNAGSRIWLSSNRMVGGVRSWQMSNIWPRVGAPTIRPTIQKCGGLISWQFTPQGQQPPPDDCLSSPSGLTAPISARATDDGLGDQSFMVEETAAAVDGVFVDESSAAFATFDESAMAVDNFETVTAVENFDNTAAATTDETVAFVDESAPVLPTVDESAAVLPVDETAGAFATVEETTVVNTVDESAATVENFDQSAMAVDSFETAVDDVIVTEGGDLATAEPSNTNTQSNTAATGAPAYAYVLFALAVVVLAAIIVVQVLIIKVKRAQDDVRV